MSSKPSKFSKLFAEHYKIERFEGIAKVNPDLFTEEETRLFEAFKKEQKQARMRVHYESRVANGTAPRHKPKNELSAKELRQRRLAGSAHAAKAYQVRQRLAEFAHSRGIKAPPLNKATLTSLRQALVRGGIDEKDLPTIENPPGAKKRGKEEEVEIDEERARKKAISSELSMKSYVRRRALYERAAQFAAMAPFVDLTIEQIRSILRQSITDADMAEIETQAVQAYDATHELVERKGTTSRSTELLAQFFEKHPDVPRVTIVGQLSHEDGNRYKTFLRSLDLERFRARDREYDAVHREERSEAGRRRREEDPERVRENEKRWRDSENGKLVAFMKDTRAWASSKGIAFELTKEEVAAMAEEPCFYCGDLNNDYSVDAVDAATGFVQENVKPCCQPCNRFKKDHDQKDFLRIMCNIGANHTSFLETDVQWTPVYEFVNPIKDLRSSPFAVYKYNAKDRDLDFQMTEEQFEVLVKDSCHYCGILRPNATNGIDRVDSSKGYIPGNIVTCCGPCNRMKNNLLRAVFVDKATKIMRIWAPRINASAGFFDGLTKSSVRKEGEE